MTDVTAELAGFTGVCLRPGDARYDEARQVFNAMIDRSPALIARATTAADVAAAVKHARANGLEISVYGGGHSVTGHAVCDDGLCIDLRGINGVQVDPSQRLAHVGGGATWGDVDAATQQHGLAVTGGRVSTTGVGGLALGSGSGWLERKAGFTCDNLVEAEVVTATGDVVIASEQENSDLFWALRGGGGNFGIVTRFTFRLHEVGPIVLGGMLMYPASMGAAVLRNFRDYMATAPDEAGGGVAFITAPPADFVPEPVRGHAVVGVIVLYAGDPDKGREVMRPILEFGPPAMAMVDAMPYVAVQQLINEPNQKGFQNYWTGDFYHDLPDEAIDTFVSIATQPVSPFTQLVVVPGGGALARVDNDTFPLGERQAKFNIHYLSMWVDSADAEKKIEFSRRLNAAMKPWSTGGVYLNFIGDEGRSRIEAAFGPQKFARLQQIKAKWDPDNVFHHNQNIPPAPVVPGQR